MTWASPGKRKMKSTSLSYLFLLQIPTNRLFVASNPQWFVTQTTQYRTHSTTNFTFFSPKYISTAHSRPLPSPINSLNSSVTISNSSSSAESRENTEKSEASSFRLSFTSSSSWGMNWMVGSAEYSAWMSWREGNRRFAMNVFFN